ncbi:MAG: type II toxin-antitoxin system RelE/ParE family toxin [Micrococcales bacterium]|nr:type II toxin-antitoxin system RelE/ParE family toxin [Micrococcales bacterium]MCL2668005.1 type II toxin-antitoxin system RelE/ParE family toxin [Micrococcales bacterium]
MTRSIIYSPRARRHLRDLYLYLAEVADPVTADKFVTAITDHCAALAEFPLRGRARDDIRPGMRTIGFRRRVLIAFDLSDDEVRVLGVFYGGRDYELLLD